MAVSRPPLRSDQHQSGEEEDSHPPDHTDIPLITHEITKAHAHMWGADALSRHPATYLSFPSLVSRTKR